eukprot:1918212-Lingulodinium_polyedra.AAC.1
MLRLEQNVLGPRKRPRRTPRHAIWAQNEPNHDILCLLVANPNQCKLPTTIRHACMVMGAS